MKTGWKVLSALTLAALMGGLLIGCGGPDAEEVALHRQINDQITVVDNQVKGLEEHQAKMRDMIKEMQTQLGAMQAELDKDGPRIIAAGDGLLRLRELTTVGFGKSAGEETLENPSYSYTNIMLIMFFLLLIWVLYRVMHRSKNQA